MEEKVIRRLEILHDVLETIGRKKIKTGNYFRVYPKGRPSGQLQELLPAFETEETCEACALGAIFVSYVRLHNNYHITEDNYNAESQCDAGNRMHIVELLENLFDADQLTLIEVAFEGGKRIRYLPDMSLADEVRAKDFYEKYPGFNNASKRLIAIVQNMIKNGGVFCP